MKTYGILTALLALTLSPGLAQDAPPVPVEPPHETPPPPPPEPVVWKNKGERKQAELLTAEFAVTERTVADLRAKGLGWGEARHALAISRKSGQPLAEVLKLRDSGLGWGQVAQRYGFKLGDVGKAAKAADREEKRDAVAERRGETGAKGRAPERAGEKGGRGGASRGGGRGGPKR